VLCLTSERQAPAAANASRHWAGTAASGALIRGLQARRGEGEGEDEGKAALGGSISSTK
jgi:hypothetical protein